MLLNNMLLNNMLLIEYSAKINDVEQRFNQRH